jgi:hypothetical protein
MKISVRLEGGGGDCLLGNRFVFAIKDKYPDSEITAYIDSEGKTFQKELLSILYGSAYKDIKIIPNKKYKQLWIDSQYGTEEYLGAIENVPDNIIAEMLSYDKFYDLHIDSLKWMDYDFDWLRYFQFFPKPDLDRIQPIEPYIVFQLISNTKNDHGLEQFYTNRLISDTSKFCKVKIICTKDVVDFYSDVKNLDNVEILDVDLKNACEIISGAECMFSIDSGLKYIGYAYSIPTLCMSKQVSSAHVPFPTHSIRWMPFAATSLPLHLDCYYVVSLIKRIFENKANILIPQFTDFNNQVIKRNYKINLEKTII